MRKCERIRVPSLLCESEQDGESERVREREREREKEKTPLNSFIREFSTRTDHTWRRNKGCEIRSKTKQDKTRQSLESGSRGSNDFSWAADGLIYAKV